LCGVDAEYAGHVYNLPAHPLQKTQKRCILYFLARCRIIVIYFKISKNRAWFTPKEQYNILSLCGVDAEYAGNVYNLQTPPLQKTAETDIAFFGRESR
jgi:hypothetical protein